MENDPLQRMKLLGERLRRVDKSLSRLTAERLSILAEIARLDAAFQAHQEQTNGRNPSAPQKSGTSTVKPNLYIPQARPPKPSKEVIDYDVDPFPAPEDRDPWDVDEESGDRAHESGSKTSTHADPGEASHAETTSTYTNDREVIVQKADTRLIIHWNAATGSVNFENGPPVDHPRLQAILCDAQIDIQHCDHNGLPTGLVTTAHHANYRQERYLAYRDGVCRIPECEGIGKTQAHHIFEDRVDRVTSVEFMINLCNRHHTEHHDGIFTITGNPESTIIFTHNDGTILTSTAKPTSLFKRPNPTPFRKQPNLTPNFDDSPMSA
jgi:hypothetical protein